MKTRVRAVAIGLAALMVGTGCYATLQVGPYVRDVQVDSEGRVTGVQKCVNNLTFSNGGRLQSADENCELAQPVLVSPAPPVGQTPPPPR